MISQMLFDKCSFRYVDGFLGDVPYACNRVLTVVSRLCAGKSAQQHTAAPPKWPQPSQPLPPPPAGFLVAGGSGTGKTAVVAWLASALAVAPDCLTHVVYLDCSQLAGEAPPDQLAALDPLVRFVTDRGGRYSLSHSTLPSCAIAICIPDS